MTKDELTTRKEKAISLLNSHTDKYRLLYAEISKITDATEEEINAIKRKSELLELECNSIHNQIRYINELIYYVEESEKTSE